ncbi:DUF6628 family protein [Sphingomonas sp.]|uniref:DUF6628 family protein n=1 Tax=Sphingomonas sp. TaxID=28214 RepID=UPI001EB9A27E|nr:DUF6628 family protein [Sphingomonas sp.]MBX3595131.1 hypothetical protein [Sphingomonas sp.]
MQVPASAPTHPLPHVQPRDPAARLVLFGIRQIGANGLNDAATAHAFVSALGVGFRRPLVLLRTLMADMSRIASGPIPIAPWCCTRMTAPEAALLAVIDCAIAHPQRASLLLGDLLGLRDVQGVLTTAQALADAFADLGMPIDASP